MAASSSIPPEALAAALAGAAKTPPPGYVQDPNAQAGGGGAPTDPSQAAGGDPNAQAPTDPTQDPNAQGGTDPNQQAVWQEFPATDPQQVDQLAQQMQQGGDPQSLIELLSGFMQQAQADQDKLSQMHTAMLSHLMDLLQGPTGGGAQHPTGPSPVPSQGPGVGGAGAGY
jgi:hypothetical protein